MPAVTLEIGPHLYRAVVDAVVGGCLVYLVVKWWDYASQRGPRK